MSETPQFLCPACLAGPMPATAAVAHCPDDVERQLVGEPAFVPLRRPLEVRS